MIAGRNPRRSGHHGVHSQPRSRIWFGTIWDMDDKLLVNGLDSQYLIISADDQTENEQLHWHCLVQFPNARVHPRTRRAHWEIPQSKIEARQYCIEKGENYIERGQLEIADQNTQDWTGFVNACKINNPREMIDGPFSKLYARFRGFAGEVHNQFAELNIMDGELENEWLYGEPGTGKTKSVWERYPDCYVKAINKWWDGYHGQEVVLLDDWDPRHEVLASHLKMWADRYPFRAETKGSSLMARPKKIIVTSNYSIRDCFQNPEDQEAFLRRFKVTHFARLNRYDE
nr:MAG: rep protein [Cressdnaviricota sp.]